MTNKEAAQALKDCPFCGGKATAHTRDAHTERPFYVVGCGAIMDNNGLYGGCLQKDNARSTYSYESMEAAVKSWNTRAVALTDNGKAEGDADLKMMVGRLARRLPKDDKVRLQAEDYLRRTFKASDVLREVEASQTPQTVEVSELYVSKCNCEGDNAPCLQCAEDAGYNAAIDHLASRGLLGTVPKYTEYEEAMDLARVLIKFHVKPEKCISINDKVYSAECVYEKLVKALAASPQPKPQNEKDE